MSAKWTAISTILTVAITVGGTLYTSIINNNSNLEQKKEDQKKDIEKIFIEQYFQRCSSMSKEYHQYMDIYKRATLLDSKQFNAKYGRPPMTGQEQDDLIDTLSILRISQYELSTFLSKSDYDHFEKSLDHVHNDPNNTGIQRSMAESNIISILISDKLRECNSINYKEH